MRTPDGLRSRAVLIGTCRYTSAELPDLPAVRNNIEDLKQVLTQPDGAGIRRGDCVDVLDATNLPAVWSRLQRAADEAEDLLLVYYAGHGVLDKRGRLYLSLPDTTRQSEYFTGVDIAKLREIIAESNASNRVLILDCCFSGRAYEAMGAADPAALATGQVEIEGTYTLTSTSANAPAHAPIGEEYTAFTGALLKTLKEGIPNGPELLTLDEIYRNILRELRAQNAPSPERRGVNNAGDLALGINHAFAAQDGAISGVSPVPTALVGPAPVDDGPLPRWRLAARTLPPTSRKRRFAALVIDVIPILGVYGIAYGVARASADQLCYTTTDSSGNHFNACGYNVSGTGTAALWIAVILVVAYLLWNWGDRQGRTGSTIGKSVLKFKVRQPRGFSVIWIMAVVLVASIVSLLVELWLLRSTGFWYSVWPGGLALADHMASSFTTAMAVTARISK